MAGACLTASLTGCSMDVAVFQESLQKNWETSEDPQAGTPPSDGTDTSQDTAVTGLPAFVPSVLEVPRIGVRQEVQELGLYYDGTLEVPEGANDVGWYSPQTRPDAAYPMIFTGHVDTVAGPAVFARLLDIEPGDHVTVTDTGGQVRTYRVDRVEDHPVDAYPTLDVFGPAPGDEIRLITCAGVFDDVREQYDENRVVYASRSE
jgi:sortase (surface protein transpeptidase)